MSLQAIADAATAQNALHDRINDFIDTLEADKAAYAALAANLIDLVEQQLDFSATWNPDEVAPDNVAGGTFSDLQLLLNSAPPGAALNIQIPDGQTVNIDTTITIHRQRVRFAPVGHGRATIIVGSHVSGQLNIHHSIRCLDGSFSVGFEDIDLIFAPKADPALDWKSLEVCIYGGFGAPPFTISLRSVTITATDTALLSRVPLGGTVFLVANASTIDGPVELVAGAQYGTLSISTNSLTLANGAIVRSQGTVGQNVIER